MSGGPTTLIAAFFCILLCGCNDAATVWTAESRSPDGLWLALAKTEQQGGPGNAGIYTQVSLKRTNVKEEPIQILAFSGGGPVPRPYTLDNKANAGGTIGLEMKWLSPSHLQVAYDGKVGHLDFQVVKCAGLEISVLDRTSADSPRSNVEGK